MMTLILASLSLVSFNCGWECKWEDESAWRKVKVPHDAQWSRPYDKAAGWQQGYAKGGIVTYRKRFAPPEGPANARYAVRFDGAYADAKVRLNGRPAGGCHNGYVPFEVELTDLEATNVLEVVCDARTQNARWYVGPACCATSGSCAGRDSRSSRSGCPSGRRSRDATPACGSRSRIRRSSIRKTANSS